MATQDQPGRHATYEWVFTSALHSLRGAVNIGIDRVAVPQIGCGIGGLEWDKVAQILVTTEILVDTKAEWEVWYFNG
jgi:O-acetyl-ADP-ribose deacetylase (regulator of RNase III)